MRVTLVAVESLTVVPSRSWFVFILLVAASCGGDVAAVETTFQVTINGQTTSSALRWNGDTFGTVLHDDRCRREVLDIEAQQPSAENRIALVFEAAQGLLPTEASLALYLADARCERGVCLFATRGERCHFRPFALSVAGQSTTISLQRPCNLTRLDSLHVTPIADGRLELKSLQITFRVQYENLTPLGDGGRGGGTRDCGSF